MILADAVSIDDSLAGIAGLAQQYASSGIGYIWQAQRTILEARYAIAAMFALQIYEWIAGCVLQSRMLEKDVL